MLFKGTVGYFAWLGNGPVQQSGSLFQTKDFTKFMLSNCTRIILVSMLLRKECYILKITRAASDRYYVQLATEMVGTFPRFPVRLAQFYAQSGD